MVLPKNIGIFGEYEEKRLKMIAKMEKEAALMQYLKSLNEYPDPTDPREQVLMEEVLKIVLEKWAENEEADA
jgi:hypothetical protein|tara:strand:- start:71 stop:286 length:216 start_codon:yes stop_codon:yes gene_type:complete